MIFDHRGIGCIRQHAIQFLGGMSALFVNVIFGSGLRAPASPGSIFAVLIATPAGSFIGVIFSVITAATM